MSRKYWIILLVVVGLVLFAAAEGVRRYASTQLAGGLAEQYGGRVTANFSRAGWTQATLREVRLYEADDRNVVLYVDELQTDLSLWDLVTGETTPQHMVLVGPQLNLRFDERGNLLTELPPSPPSSELPRRIDLKQGKLLVYQGDQPPTEISGLNGSLTGRGRGLALASTLTNERWGKWDISGSLDPAQKHLAITANTPSLHVTPAWLRNLPLVPRTIWEQIVAEGDFSVQAALDYGPAAGTPMLKADIGWEQAEVVLPKLDAVLANTSGRAKLADTRLELTQFQGTLAGGTVSATGTADVNSEPLQMDLQLAAEGLDVAKLPDGWSLPEDIEGSVSGGANVAVEVAGEEVSVSGEGRAAVSDASIAGTPIEPFEVELQASEPPPGDEPPAEPPTAIGPVKASGWATFPLRLRNAPIADLLRRSGQVPEDQLPPIEGTVSCDLEVKVPLASFNNPATYQVSGNVSSPALSVEDLQITGVETQVRFADGYLLLDPFTAQLPAAPGIEPGQLAGALEAQIFPQGNVGLELSGASIPLSALSQIANLQPEVQGFAEFEIYALSPLDRVAQPAAWEAAGHVTIPWLRVGERELADLTSALHLAQGRLRLSEAAATVAGIRVPASATVEIDDPYAFVVELQLPVTDVKPLLAFAAIEPGQPVAGRMQATGRVEGSLQPLVWRASGTGRITEPQFGRWSATESSFRWSVNPETFELSDLQATAYGGVINGEISGPLDPAADITAEGHFENVRLEQIGPNLLPEKNLAVNGPVSGSFSLSGQLPDALRGRVEIRSPEIMAQGIRAASLQGEVQLRDGSIEYHAGASVLGGQVSARGELHSLDPAAAAGSGVLSVERLDLRRLSQEIGPLKSQPVDGLLTMKLDYSHAGSEMPTGHGRVVVSDFRWGSRDVPTRLEGDVILRRSQIEFPSLFVRLGDGSLRARLRYDLERAQGGYSLTLDRVPAEQLLVAWPELAAQIEGPIDARLAGLLGSRITATGSVAMARGRLAGMEIAGVRLPVRLSYAAENARGQLQIEESSAQFARGRVVGGAEVTFGRTISVDGKMRLVNLQPRSVLASSGSLGQIGAGRVSGTVTFSSQDLRSINDLRGRFDITMGQSQAMQLPVLRSVARYVVPTTSTNTSFDSGEIRGRLARGVVYVEEATLTGDQARLLIDGTITLPGRLNLDVTAQRGSGPVAQGFIQRFALPIIQSQVAPTSLLTQTNTLLADQLIFLHVGGTVRSPSIRLSPARQLGYEGLRYFLNATPASTLR